MTLLRPDAGASRRLEVLRAVAELIARHGIDGMSMRQVAEACGMSTGTINYHFRNKRGLIMATMDFVYSVPQDWQRFAGLPALEQLRTRAAIAIIKTEGRRQWGRFWLEYAAHAGRDPVLLESHVEHYKTRRRVFLDTIEAGQRKGEVRLDIDPQAATDGLLALIDGVLTQQIAFGLSGDDAERIIFSFIDGLRPQQG